MEKSVKFGTHEWTDCVFVFDDDFKIPAHKLILSYSSPVFESMFYGSMASPEVFINDIDSQDFNQMLEYIYTKKIALTSINNAWSLIYISQKYFINNLKSICIEYIYFNLTISTLLLSYEYALLYNLSQLLNKCWGDILLTAKEVLQVDYHMKATTLCRMLDENEINAKETDLIEAAIKWSEDECVFQNITVSRENKLNILIDTGILSRLRFSTLGKNCCQYLYRLLASNLDNLSDCINMITTQRHSMPYHIKYRFRETYKIEKNLVLDDTNEFHSIISAGHEVVIYGVAITQPHKDGFQEARTNVIVSIFDYNGVLLSQARDVLRTVSDYEVPHLVSLPKGIKFMAATKYKISVKYLCDSDSNKPNELLCFYLSCNIKTHANSLSVEFDDQLCGGIVRGLSFYVF
ncbi:hypothetical protein RI129_004161 [Pyrocoelia pectoralis]|uniref:BTB domain-containing protein n=1 Tax=Pyrocoelia pectoralis TaxID=417401 RepID=A0AAN7ZKB1_9COLE